MLLNYTFAPGLFADRQILKINIHENTIFLQFKKIGTRKINEFTVQTYGES